MADQPTIEEFEAECRTFLDANAKPKRDEDDKKFVWASAKILPDGRIEVSAAAVKEPVAVRYAWADNPVVNMYSTAGLPLTPFRTDDWPGVTIDNK